MFKNLLVFSWFFFLSFSSLPPDLLSSPLFVLFDFSVYLVNFHSLAHFVGLQYSPSLFFCFSFLSFFGAVTVVVHLFSCFFMCVWFTRQLVAMLNLVVAWHVKLYRTRFLNVANQTCNPPDVTFLCLLFSLFNFIFWFLFCFEKTFFDCVCS